MQRLISQHCLEASEGLQLYIFEPWLALLSWLIQRVWCCHGCYAMLFRHLLRTEGNCLSLHQWHVPFLGELTSKNGPLLLSHYYKVPPAPLPLFHLGQLWRAMPASQVSIWSIRILIVTLTQPSVFPSSQICFLPNKIPTLESQLESSS